MMFYILNKSLYTMRAYLIFDYMWNVIKYERQVMSKTFFLRIHALLYKCIVHVCSECHVCVRHSLGLISNFGNKLTRYNESNCTTILIVVI